MSAAINLWPRRTSTADSAPLELASPSIDWRIVVAAIPLEQPPSYGGLLYWMQEMVKWSSAELQRHFVQDEVIPHFYFFAPQV
ncbi:MAG: hypothetical protein JOY96_00330 [Verrucomicrobia bacterium]|nr:hypothetical protein [Verrucomicrobiota bacterium]